MVLPDRVAADCHCVGSGWQIANVRSASDWREFNLAGQEIVRESGSLAGVAVAGVYQCDAWTLGALVGESQGARVYEGQTTTGDAALSRAEVRQRQAQLQAMFAVLTRWHLGARLSRQTQWRNIQSIQNAAGYPERFDWSLFSVGTQWQTDLGPGQLTLSAWAGRPLQSNMRVSLPGRDPTVLQPGSIAQTELNAGWRAQLTSAWYVQAEIGFRHTAMQPGPPSTVRRNSLPVGEAYQPRTRMTDRPIAVWIGFEF
jgi:hypothetical protein